jgi:hypothetical protein
MSGLWKCPELEAEYERIALGLAGAPRCGRAHARGRDVLTALLARNPLSTDGYALLLELYIGAAIARPSASGMSSTPGC